MNIDLAKVQLALRKIEDQRLAVERKIAAGRLESQEETPLSAWSGHSSKIPQPHRSPSECDHVRLLGDGRGFKVVNRIPLPNE